MSIMVQRQNKPVKMRGSSTIGFYGDLVFYNGSAKPVKSPETPPAKPPGYGLKLYLKGKAGVWGREFGISYGVGAGTYALTDVYPIIYLGLYVTL